jgi:hypothetical protein
VRRGRSDRSFRRDPSHRVEARCPPGRRRTSAPNPRGYRGPHRCRSRGGRRLARRNYSSASSSPGVPPTRRYSADQGHSRRIGVGVVTGHTPSAVPTGAYRTDRRLRASVVSLPGESRGESLSSRQSSIAWRTTRPAPGPAGDYYEISRGRRWRAAQRTRANAASPRAQGDDAQASRREEPAA